MKHVVFALLLLTACVQRPAPVANDAQGDLGDPTSKHKVMYDRNHWSGMAKCRWAMAIDHAHCTCGAACVTGADDSCTAASHAAIGSPGP